ncbi:MAG TPA: S4 domain-containing protein [Chitinophaga sp.]
MSFTADNGIFPSKSEARKMVQNGGVSINKQKVESIEATVNTTHLLNEKYILVQKGRRNYYLVIVE